MLLSGNDIGDIGMKFLAVGIEVGHIHVTCRLPTFQEISAKDNSISIRYTSIYSRSVCAGMHARVC